MDRKSEFIKKNPSATLISTVDFMPVVEEMIANGQSVEISPRGISMLPLIREGRDSVVLEPINRELRKYDIPLYRRDDGSYILHRIVDITDGEYRLIGDNQYVYENGVKKEQMIAVVSTVRRGEKLISVNSRSHRFYAFMLHNTRGIRHFSIRVARKIKRTFSHK